MVTIKINVDAEMPTYVNSSSLLNYSFPVFFLPIAKISPHSVPKGSLKIETQMEKSELR